MLSSQAPRYLELLAHASPLPPARVRLELSPENGGTRITMFEDVEDPVLRKVLWPVVQPTTWIQ